MKVSLLMMGKTSEAYAVEGMELYRKKLRRYLDLECPELPAPKSTGKSPAHMHKTEEGKIFIERWPKADCVILLDEHGKEFDSTGFAAFFQQRMNAGNSHFLFIIGGPYGFSDEVTARADFRISLSKMTFNHQMVRLIFLEQLFRAMTILRNEPYHNV